MLKSRCIMLSFMTVIFALATPARSECPPHSSPAREERGDGKITVICNCDPGYFKVDGQCLSRDKARTELQRRLAFKAIAYKGAVDHVKHTANAFGFHIDTKGYAALQDLKPKLPYIVGTLVALLIYKHPETAADLSKEAVFTAVSATTAATIFVTNVLNDCNFSGAETKGLCKNFSRAVLDLQPRIDAFNAAKEDLEKLY